MGVIDKAKRWLYGEDFDDIDNSNGFMGEGGGEEDESEGGEGDESESGGEDNANPFGADADPYGNDNPPDKDDGGEGEEKEDKGEDKKPAEKSGDANGKLKGKMMVKGENYKKLKQSQMKQMAKALGCPGVPLPVPCPVCGTKNGGLKTLFLEKPMSSGLRITLMIIRGCIGTVSMEEIPGAVRCVCMNPKCKSYYKTTGDKFYYSPSGMLQTKHNIFHADI